MTKGFHYHRQFNAESAQMKMKLVYNAIKAEGSIIGVGRMEEEPLFEHFYSQYGPSFMKDSPRQEVAVVETLDNHLVACSYTLLTWVVEHYTAVHIYFVIESVVERSLLWLMAAREELSTHNCSRTMVSFEVGWDP